MGNFEKLIQGAKAGNGEDIEHLLRIYYPLISHYGRVDGKLDEDLMQHLQLEFVLALMKFEIL